MKTVERGVVGDRSQMQGVPQLAVLGQADLGFAIGPVLIAHEAQDGQQLRLREFVFAELGAIARYRRLRHIQGDTRELYQTNFGHGLCGTFAEL